MRLIMLPQWKKKTLETPHRIWYIERKEGHLLVTGVPQNGVAHSNGGFSRMMTLLL